MVDNQEVFDGELREKSKLPYSVTKKDIEVERRDGNSEHYSVEIYKKNSPDARILNGNFHIARDLDTIKSLVRTTFNDYTEPAYQFILGPGGVMDRNDILDIVRNSRGEIVAFHSYFERDTTIEELGNQTVRVIYTQSAGVAHSERGSSLSFVSRLPVLEQESPDVITGETIMPPIDVTAGKVAETLGYVKYPRIEEAGKPIEIPPAILRLGKRALGVTIGENAANQLDEMLVRTSPSTNPLNAQGGRSVDRRPYPLFDEPRPLGLGLRGDQHATYLLVKPSLNHRLRALGK